MIGKIINKRYEIKEKIGSGGTAIVYKGHDLVLNRLITVKILREEFNDDKDFVRRFQHEAQAIASLSHGNIVNVYDVGEEDGCQYIVMEFVEGETLKEYIKRRGALPIEEAAEIICQILDAVGYAHSHGIVHRDIKPHNILFTKDGRIKVTDFGIAAGPSEMTQTYDSDAKVMGSVHYISPEQVQGEPITEKSDIYSVGVVFYEMLTGTLPFSGDSPIGVAMQHVQKELKPPHQVKSGIPVGLSYVIMRAMRKNPDIRFASAQEMKESVRSVVDGAPGGVKPAAADVVAADTPSLQDTQEIKVKDYDFKEARRKREQTVPGVPPVGNPQTHKKQLNKRNIFVALVIVLILAIAIIGVSLMDTVFSSPDIVVPNVVGQELEAAKQMLRDSNLAYTLYEDYSPEVAAGYIISQDINEGDMVKKGRNIGITVSLGTKTVEVPKVTNLLRAQAEDMLKNSGLECAVTEVYDLTVAEDTVMKQEPAAGTPVTEKTTVKITVSLGVKPALVVVPNFVGQKFSEVRANLAEKMLVLSKVSYQESNSYNYGYIISQTLAANTEVEQNTTIEFVVSDGPGPVAKSATVSLSVPNDGNEHTVKIVVTDSQGTRDEYNAKQASGTQFSRNVTFYNSGTITVYLDGEIVNESAVS